MDTECTCTNPKSPRTQGSPENKGRFPPGMLVCEPRAAQAEIYSPGGKDPHMAPKGLGEPFPSSSDILSLIVLVTNGISARAQVLLAGGSRKNLL